MQLVKATLIVSTVVLIASVAALAQAVGTGPRVFVMGRPELRDRKDRTRNKKPCAIADDLEARNVLKSEIRSIVTKDAAPPSGDKHDYMSQAPYFWRNPKTADGFPYIRRDGERNPEIKKYPDHDLLDKMIAAVEKLSRWILFYRTRRVRDACGRNTSAVVHRSKNKDESEP